MSVIRQATTVIPAHCESIITDEVIRNGKKAFRQSPHGVDDIVVDEESTDITTSGASRSGATVVSHITQYETSPRAIDRID